MTEIAEVPQTEPGVDARERHRHNLPVQLTSFIGRDAELTQVRALLADSRMVTLTGAGGVGKTRLALQIADAMLPEFPAGVWLVELAPLSDPALVPVTVALALDLPDTQGRPTIATITSFIGQRRALVVLDNCEHLLDASAVLAEELLRACPALTIVATSREPVGAAGEATWRVPSLPVDGAAVELLVDRARRARPGFAVTAENNDAVAEICRRLDGIPLAIELAAARMRAFSPAEIAAGLRDRFRLLTGGSRTAARRQQTLRASVDWSHALLTETERVLFRRLAAFAGGFDLDAAQAVGAADSLRADEVVSLLGLLVDKSLVTAEESDGPTRYRLPETVRQYAAEKLADSGEAGQVRARHLGYFTAMAGRLDRSADGDRRNLIRQLEADIDNLRAAFTWSLELSDIETGLRLTVSLQPVWLGRFRQLEGLAWFEVALDGRQPGAESVAAEVRVQAVAEAAVLDVLTRTPLRRAAQVEESVALARQLGNPSLLAKALLGAGYAAGPLAGAARPYLAEAAPLARQAGDTWTLARILGREAMTAFISGDLVTARSVAEEGLAVAGQTGNDHTSRLCQLFLGATLVLQGDLYRARSLLGDVIAAAEVERLPWWAMFGLGFLGQALAWMGDPDAARQAAHASIAIADDFDLGIANPVPGLSALSLAAMASADIAALRETSQAIRQQALSMPEFGYPHDYQMAEVSLAAADIAAARTYADDATATAMRLGTKQQMMIALTVSARVATAASDVARAHDDAYQALSIARGIQSRIGIIDALECLGGLAPDSQDQHKAVRLLGAADALRHATGYQRFQLHQSRFDAAVAVLRSSMGDAAFAAAWQEGAALTCDEAVSYALRGRGERSRPPIGWLSLTPAEREVAQLVAEGLSNNEIATRLFVSPRTAQTHLTHIYAKLGVTSRAQLVRRAARET